MNQSKTTQRRNVHVPKYFEWITTKIGYLLKVFHFNFDNYFITKTYKTVS